MCVCLYLALTWTCGYIIPHLTVSAFEYFFSELTFKDCEVCFHPPGLVCPEHCAMCTELRFCRGISSLYIHNIDCYGLISSLETSIPQLSDVNFQKAINTQYNIFKTLSISMNVWLLYLFMQYCI